MPLRNHQYIQSVNRYIYTVYFSSLYQTIIVHNYILVSLIIFCEFQIGKHNIILL